jgi:hypothetical protein
VKRLFVLGTIGITALLTIDAGAAVTIVNSSPRILKTSQPRRTVETTSREKWVGTKAIIRDVATGKVRKPTAAETEQLVSTIRQLAARPAVRTQSTTRQGTSEDGYQQIIIARATEEGGLETLCVSTFEEAATFLGLVQQQPSGSEQ